MYDRLLDATEIAEVVAFLATRGTCPTASPTLQLGSSHSETFGYCPIPLSVGYAGGNGAAGSYFRVKAKHSALYILGFDIHTVNSGSGTVKVYHKTGSFVGYEATPGAWTLAQTFSVTAGSSSGNGGYKVQDQMNFASPIAISGGASHSFFMITSLGVRYTNGNTFDSLKEETDDLAFYEGKGTGSEFSSTTLYSPRVWNGLINYAMHPDSTPQVRVQM